ncbi:hypothetical protein F0562_003306 [Nyssa sinensis]|uniref:Retrovirus-related Pol polyprotein from transposon TNT 1-94-like beta-barrel domain-containing protein n=1 Tax=Nyssa sinensis TaxID=561372 RepID=A0A5J5BYT8_9ASTE|nr:hypothetical protein F0562_003306 [Nyssa sinensis]
MEKYRWWRPDAICGNCKQLGHLTKVCKYKNKCPQSQQAQAVNADPREEQLFAASCFSSYDSGNTWLVDSGYTHHMCHNVAMFRDLDETYSSKVKIGNSEYVKVKGRGTTAVKTTSSIKLIPDVLFVPDISQNLLSVGQMLKKEYSLQFKDNQCNIFDSSRAKLVCVKMRSKSFSINWKQAAEHAYAGITQSVSNLWHRRSCWRMWTEMVSSLIRGFSWMSLGLYLQTQSLPAAKWFEQVTGYCKGIGGSSRSAVLLNSKRCFHMKETVVGFSSRLIAELCSKFCFPTYTACMGGPWKMLSLQTLPSQITTAGTMP